jgi:dihydrofolate synthase/folylpolyglutamate synthase
MPNYQQRNWLLANRAYNYLVSRDKLQNLTSKELSQSHHIQVPGRMDISLRQGKTVIMDGAHNAQKMGAFVESFKQLFPEIRPAVLIALKNGKEYQTVVPVIGSIAGRVIVTTFETSQDLPARAIDPEVLAGEFSTYNTNLEVKCVTNYRDAYKELLSLPEKVVVVTGSFYLLSQIRKYSA